MDRMKATLDPAFTDVTWGAGGSTADLSLDIALTAHQKGHVANLHMTCTNIQSAGVEVDPKQAVQDALQAAYDGGIRNIVALRGDPPAGEEEWKATEGGFSCALDLVKFIKAKFGDEFGISVAGYPEGHPNAISEIADPSTMTATEAARSSSFDGKTYACRDADYATEMAYLKAKVDAGAGKLSVMIRVPYRHHPSVEQPFSQMCIVYTTPLSSFSSFFLLSLQTLSLPKCSLMPPSSTNL